MFQLAAARDARRARAFVEEPPASPWRLAERHPPFFIREGRIIPASTGYLLAGWKLTAYYK
jgi:hypothetical protein